MKLPAWPLDPYPSALRVLTTAGPLQSPVNPGGVAARERPTPPPPPPPPGGTVRPPRPLPSRALALAGAPGLAGAGPTSPPPRPGPCQLCPLPGPGLRGPLWPATPALLPCVVSPAPRRPREGGRRRRSRLRGLRGPWAQVPRRRRLGAREPGRWDGTRVRAPPGAAEAPAWRGVLWLQGRGAGQGLWRIAPRWRGGGRGSLGGRYQPRLQKRKLRPERERDEPKVTRWSCPAAPPAPPKSLTPFSGWGMVPPDWPDLGAGNEDLL